MLVLKCYYIEQAKIISLTEYFTLGGCTHPERKGKETPYEQATITACQKIFHFGRVCWSWQANTHIRAERASHNNSWREYITLEGCAGPRRPIHTYEQREQATITVGENISLWEGVLVLAGQYTHTSRESKQQK